MFSRGSRNRLTEHDLARFAGPTLFDALGRAVCRAACLPRKELYESWEVGRRVRRLFRGGRIVDVAAGHGLLSHVLLLLDDSSRCAIAVDQRQPESAARMHELLVHEWPHLSRRVEFRTCALHEVDLQKDDLVVSAHACGSLTDRVLGAAVAAGAKVAVLPCCHDLAANDTGQLTGWLPGPLAIDATRARRLAARGYRIWTQTIPEDVTPQNRLLLGAPLERACADRY
jgi:hypothetical protein